MGRTDGLVERSGVYQSTCECRLQTSASKGSAFPACGVCGSVEWKQIRDEA